MRVVLSSGGGARPPFDTPGGGSHAFSPAFVASATSPTLVTPGSGGRLMRAVPLGTATAPAVPLQPVVWQRRAARGQEALTATWSGLSLSPRQHATSPSPAVAGATLASGWPGPGPGVGRMVAGLDLASCYPGEGFAGRTGLTPANSPRAVEANKRRAEAARGLFKEHSAPPAPLGVQAPSPGPLFRELSFGFPAAGGLLPGKAAATARLGAAGPLPSHFVAAPAAVTAAPVLAAHVAWPTHAAVRQRW